MQIVARLLAVTLCAFAALGAPTWLAFSAKVHAGSGGGDLPGEIQLVLQGVFEPVEQVPHLGLELVDSDDGMWGKINCFRAAGLPNTPNLAIGTFYEKYGMSKCAYDLPGGAFVAVIEEMDDHYTVIGGELFQYATVELSIPEATGIYRGLVGGDIHMNFVRHIIDRESLHEHCECFIHPPASRDAAGITVRLGREGSQVSRSDGRTGPAHRADPQGERSHGVR